MFLETVVLDFRCSSCAMIRRVDARLPDSVVSHLPEGWSVIGGRVVCQRCVPESDTERQYRPSPSEENRRKASEARLESGSTRDPFLSRQNTSGDLTPPTEAAPVPIVPSHCGICHEPIAEDDSDWRPDPEAAGFARVHNSCHRHRAQERQRTRGRSDIYPESHQRQ